MDYLWFHDAVSTTCEVKNPDKFERLLQSLGIAYARIGAQLYKLIPNDFDLHSSPLQGKLFESWEPVEEYEPVDAVAEIARHLVEGESVLVHSLGDFLTPFRAVIFDSSGKCIRLDEETMRRILTHQFDQFGTVLRDAEMMAKLSE